MALFGKFGALDSVTTYAARNYAFVYFKHLDDAKRAKDTLQGSLVRGNAIKIEFARPARPGKNLWVGGVCPSVSKEQLESEFSKFGKIEEYKFLRDRNSALINYYKVDDAIAALKNMNGKRLGGEQLRVDYLRSQPSRRDWLDHHDPRDMLLSKDPSWMQPESMRNFPEGFPHGHKRLQPPVGRRDIQSKILWIGYPPSVQIDEQMLHNAMILFGEIEQIKCFPSKHYSIVEFRSIDEARRAKEGLQGRLFNDPRIQILFSTSELMASKDNLLFIPGPRAPRPDMFFGEHPFGHVEHFGHGRPMPPAASPEVFCTAACWGGPSPSRGSSFLPLGVQSSSTTMVALFIASPMGVMAATPWARASEGYLPPGPLCCAGHAAAGEARLMGLLMKLLCMQAGWAAPPPKESETTTRPTEARGGAARSAGGDPPPPPPPAASLPAHSAPGREHIWRGIIAKGGTPVCCARCVPLGKGIESPFPEVVNCSAKTGLDTLAKHYSEAVGFEIVFFLPDSEEDFGSYTEFLQYLGQNSRAGVAKLDDGTTMFLVPPSEFLTEVLNVSGPKRLYGVVLKMPPPPPASPARQPPALLSVPQYADRRQHYEEQSLQREYNRALPEEPQQMVPSLSTAHAGKPGPSPPVDVSLTPDLIATLASLIPTAAQTSSAAAQVPLSSSEKGMAAAQIWGQEPQASAGGSHEYEQTRHPSLMQGHHQYGNQPPHHLSQQQQQQQQRQQQQLSSYQGIGGTMADSSGHALPGSQVQDGGGTGRPFGGYAVSSQSGQFVAAQGNQQNLLEMAGLQAKPSGAAHVQSGSVLQQHQMVAAQAAEKGNAGFPSQGQQLQSALSSGQGPSETEADKNQRYQSTLQFAASLLLQIQQQQQQQQQGGKGPGNQQ
ncbi:unnamed protein product [Spirodela intermedia]|uniref:RRM domain-containing protein n=1 Tax=Spirodela intermedia TaxID=51605 RepID=A0A7I8JC56_SPIIN|nr:unnamed protein product [Spirodela intermedia]CAA6667736.1 unnamed protein product [Spirodela intermedia]